MIIREQAAHYPSIMGGHTAGARRRGRNEGSIYKDEAKGFGLVSPLPGICPALHLDTAITLPVGVEAYAAYALRARLARDQVISARTRRFAKWSAIGSFALGMAGQPAT
jgi:hypothetical protein